jgi:hypothetical protein
MTKVFFCTDIHGSTRCWRKLVSTGEFYGVDQVILGGDMTGKAVVPVVRQKDGTCTSNFLGRKWTLKDAREVEEHKKLIVDAGMYVFEGTPEDLEELRDKKDRVDEIFKEKVIERIREWLKIAEMNLKPKHRWIIVAPGNDDQEYIDSVLRESDVIIDAEGRVLDLDGCHEMLSSGWSNPTPWHTARECSEEDLEKKIEAMASQIKNMETSIFNLHAPPFGSGLDVAPRLKENLEMHPRETSEVGSTAVLEMVKRYQPLLGLHGHIHEVTGKRQIGKTLCVNPGSNYTEGILSGVIVTLDDRKIKSTVFTSG